MHFQLEFSSIKINNSSNNTILSNNNNFYANNIVSYNNVIYSSLTDWRPIFNTDMHSVSINPMYSDYIDLRITNTDLWNKGTPITYITTDRDGDVRNIYTPDIGADEWCFSGIANNFNKISIELFPNPTSDIINLKFNDEKLDIKSMELFDNASKNIFSKVVNKYFYKNEIFKLNVGNVAPGTYFIRVTTQKHSEVKMVSIVR